MKTRPIVPARIEWRDDGVPWSPDHGDVYHSAAGALLQARHVFLGGNGLPERWAGRADFVVAETGFGLGNNFLATWNAWRLDEARCARLHYVAIEARPPSRADFERAPREAPLQPLAAALLETWPAPTPNLHALDLEGGRVRLLLALGDVSALLPELVFRADAFYLDGFAPRSNPDMWDPRVLKALGRRAAPQATAATWSVARGVHEGLRSAGFEVERSAGSGGKRHVTRAQHKPFRPLAPQAGLERRAVIVGAGLAGASTAAALAQLGWQVRVLERASAAADGASGNPAGLFHGTVHRDDGVHARLFRAAALQAQRQLGAEAAVPHGQGGLLRLETSQTLDAMQAVLSRQGLPAEHVQALSAAAASQRAGAALQHPAWFYPGGGWVSPAAWVRQLLVHPQVQLQYGVGVDRIERAGGRWWCFDAHDRVLEQCGTLVLANAEGASVLLHSAGLPTPPLRRTRGQVSWWHGDGNTPSPLRLPVAGAGYALPLPDGGVLCGATTSDSADALPSAADDHANFERLHALTGLVPPADAARWRSRVGWRVHTDDRLPIAGPVAALNLGPGQRLDQARLVPRDGGLHLVCAFGGRGLTLAPLLGRLVAARIAGTPWPLEQSLVDAVDPVRWLVRAARRPDQN